jgi:hypothetical protein
VKLLGKINPRVEEVRADEVRQGDQLASGAFQSFAMSNAHVGERVLEVSAEDDLVYVVGESAPDFAWTLTPDESVAIVKES